MESRLAQRSLQDPSQAVILNWERTLWGMDNNAEECFRHLRKSQMTTRDRKHLGHRVGNLNIAQKYHIKVLRYGLHNNTSVGTDESPFERFRVHLADSASEDDLGEIDYRMICPYSLESKWLQSIEERTLVFWSLSVECSRDMRYYYRQSVFLFFDNKSEDQTPFVKAKRAEASVRGPFRTVTLVRLHLLSWF